MSDVTPAGGTSPLNPNDLQNLQQATISKEDAARAYAQFMILQEAQLILKGIQKNQHMFKQSS